MSKTEEEIILEYLDAYSFAHGGVWPTLDFSEDGEIIWITHHPSVMLGDEATSACLDDLELWAKNLLILNTKGTKGLDALIHKLAPVNIREVFAYELSASTGGQ